METYITKVYKSPSFKSKEFIDELLNHVLQVGFKNNKRHVICGDFNIDVSKDNEDSCDLLEQLNSLNFTLITDKYDPTRIGLKSKSTIDLVFTNFDSKTDVRIHSVTDHYAVILSTTQIRLELTSLIKEKIQEHITGHENAKEMLTVIEQSILEALDKVVPCKNNYTATRRPKVDYKSSKELLHQKTSCLDQICKSENR